MTTYTNEQLASMTQEQLQAVILQSQAEQVASTDTAAVVATDVAAEQTDTEKAISQVKASIASLEDAGSDLFKAEISALKEKLAALEAEAQQIVSDVQMAEQSFAKKYGQAAAHGVEIILLAIIAGKLLGAL